MDLVGVGVLDRVADAFADDAQRLPLVVFVQHLRCPGNDQRAVPVPDGSGMIDLHAQHGCEAVGVM